MRFSSTVTFSGPCSMSNKNQSKLARDRISGTSGLGIEIQEPSAYSPCLSLRFRRFFKVESGLAIFGLLFESLVFQTCALDSSGLVMLSL